MTVTCQCPDDDHDCPNIVELSPLDETEAFRPIVCTPCLYGCLP